LHQQYAARLPPPPKNIKFSRFVNLFLYSQGAWRRPSKARAKFEWGF